jgi:hypothetical protein
MGSLLVICQVRTESVDHYHNESSIIHIRPIGTANKFIIRISYKRAVHVNTEVWFVKAGHCLLSLPKWCANSPKTTVRSFVFLAPSLMQWRSDSWQTAPNYSNVSFRLLFFAFCFPTLPIVRVLCGKFGTTLD